MWFVSARREFHQSGYVVDLWWIAAKVDVSAVEHQRNQEQSDAERDSFHSRVLPVLPACTDRQANETSQRK